MSVVTVTGKTFEHRDRLKDLGGRWDSSTKRWQFDYASKHDITQLKQLVGCMVTVKDHSKPNPLPELPKNETEQFIDFVERRFSQLQHGRSGQTAIYGDDQTYLNYFSSKNPMAFFGFSSLSTMCKFIDAIPEHKRVGARDAGWATDDPSWYGTSDMGEALNLARNGWREGVENAARVVEFLNLEHATARRRSYSVAGGRVSVGRMLAGNPAHMVKRPKQPGRRVVTLFAENTASASINARNLTVRAAVIAALADILERQGYSCTIVSVTNQVATPGGSPGAQTAVTLKHAGEKLNIEDLAFALGHPSFLRRFNFACVSQSDECRSIWLSQGYPRPAFNENARNEFYIRHLTNNVERDTLENMALNMLPIIKPEGLEIEI